MNNYLSILMLAALLACTVFYSVKSWKYKSENEKEGSDFTISLFIGMVLGIFVGIFTSNPLTHIIFTEQFIETYSNPDIGEASFYIIITFILTVLFGLLACIIKSKLSKE